MDQAHRALARRAQNDVPIMISRDQNPDCGYWDDVINRVGPTDLDLRFIDFFDFDQAGFIDFQYYLVHIEGSSKYPILAGHRALVEISFVKVLAEPPFRDFGFEIYFVQFRDSPPHWTKSGDFRYKRVFLYNVVRER